jgi:hypothetical protein
MFLSSSTTFGYTSSLSRIPSPRGGLPVCGGCKRTWYCSREHQKYDWKHHKKKCKKQRQQTNDVAESGQVAINSNGMSITGSPPRGDGIRDSEDVYPKVVDDLEAFCF